VACIAREEWEALPPDDYPVSAPALIVEALSPSNAPAKVARQRIVAMSAGASEFWVVDAAARTIEVTDLEAIKLYSGEDVIPFRLTGGTIVVSEIFAV
jgi:Uma2 family endonuclease